MRSYIFTHLTPSFPLSRSERGKKPRSKAPSHTGGGGWGRGRYRKVYIITYIIIFNIIYIKSAFSQDYQKKIDLNGYVSSLNSAMFESVKDPFIIDNLIHNRLNFKAYLGTEFTFALETRNRLFMGDLVRLSTSYSETIASDQGLADLSWNLADEHSFFLNTTVDRLWLDFNTGKFQARIGRQRINWGQALVWNPNDIFNAYSYFDFDYVERPGSDAVRLQYYPGSSSTIELAVKANHDKEITAAALYRFNKWSYDFQFLAGIMDDYDLVAGFGWSGAIGSVSFRGEGSWFQHYEQSMDNGTGMFTFGADKIFKNNSMLQAQFLLCNNPFEFDGVTGLYSSRNMSVKDLAFSKFSAFSSYSYPITPLFNASVSGMWFPDREGFFTGLSVDLSASENIDFTVLWQHFDGVFGSGERTKINLAFLRVKYSF